MSVEQHRTLAIRALEQLKGDNLYRARAAFRNMSEGQMREQYGQSGMTRAEILLQYEDHEAKVQVAIDWVKEVKHD